MPVSPEVRQELTKRIATSQPGSPQVTAALLGPDSNLFSLLERAEVASFPDMANLPVGNFFFWLLSQDSQPLHAMRLGFPETRNGLIAPYLAHQLVDSGQIAGGRLQEELRQREIRLSHCVSVESSFRIALKAAKTSALFSYLGLTKFLQETQRDAALAHQNRIAERSFKRANLYAEPLSITTQLGTPSFTNPSEVDPRYWPIVLPVAGPNQQLMESKADLTPAIPKIDIDIRHSAALGQALTTQESGDFTTEQPQE